MDSPIFFKHVTYFSRLFSFLRFLSCFLFVIWAVMKAKWMYVLKLPYCFKCHFVRCITFLRVFLTYSFGSSDVVCYCLFLLLFLNVFERSSDKAKKGFRHALVIIVKEGKTTLQTWLVCVVFFSSFFPPASFYPPPPLLSPSARINGLPNTEKMMVSSPVHVLSCSCMFETDFINASSFIIYLSIYLSTYLTNYPLSC